MGMATTNELMAKRAAEEIHHGMIVNLGIGMPSTVPDFMDKDKDITFHSENGLTRMGPSPLQGEEDENLCNAGGLPVTLLCGGAYFDSATAFGIVRRGLIDLSILGALQVSSAGDLANWIVPGRRVPGIGGAVELASKSKKVVVMMKHTDKSGNSKLVAQCSLPLTAKRCVDIVITDRAVFSIQKGQLIMQDLFYPNTVPDIKAITSCDFAVADEIRTLGGPQM